MAMRDEGELNDFPGPTGVDQGQGDWFQQNQPTAQASNRQGVLRLYNEVLGRDPQEWEYQVHKDNPNYEATIRGSQEARWNDFGNPNRTERGTFPGLSAAPGVLPGQVGKPAGGGATSSADFGRLWQASGGRTVTDLQNFVNQHPEFGVKLGGSKGDKVYGPDGKFWADAVISAGIGGGQGATWDTSTGGGGGGGGQLALGDFGSLAQGFQGQFSRPEFTEQFKPPSLEEIRATPGYQFALTEGVGALDKAAAARGTLLGGGQKKNIMNYATGLADQTAQQQYGNKVGEYGLRQGLAQQNYQNALGEYMNQYTIFRNNQNDVFNRFDTLSNRGTNAAGQATS